MRIVLTGGRSPLALFIGKKLKQQGHDIYMLEHITPTFATYSTIFTKVEIIAPPATQWETFRIDVLSFVEKYHIDLLLPVNEETLYYGGVQDEIRKRGTRFLIGSQKLLNILHHKLDFIQWCEQIGIAAPKSEVYQGQEVDFSKQLLKPIYSRFGQSVITSKDELSTNKPIEDMIVQEKIEGQQICVSLMLKEGNVISAVAYDTNLGIENFASITFRRFEHPKLTTIINTLSRNLGDNGFFSFDFMFDGENFYPIECNPRLTFGLVLDSERIINGLIAPVNKKTTKTATSYGIKLLWLGKIVTKKDWRNTYPAYLKSKDVLKEAFEWRTWLMLPWVLGTYLFKAQKNKRSITDFVVYDISYPSVRKDEKENVNE
jgi:predicted ATP-grasp superfamily ATP-dependent carboligase